MGSIKHAKTSPVPNPLGDTRRVGGGDWNSEHVIDLDVSDIDGLEARLIPVEQVEQFRDDALAFRNEAAASASDAADSAAAAAATLADRPTFVQLAADDGASALHQKLPYPNAINRSQEERNKEFVSLSEFGVPSDAGAAFLKAFTDLAGKGKHLFLPALDPGVKYQVGADLLWPSEMMIVGRGRGSAIQLDGCSLIIRDVSYVVGRDFELSRIGAAGPALVCEGDAEGFRRSYFDNVGIQGSTGRGAVFSGGWLFTWVNPYLRSCVDSALVIEEGAFTTGMNNMTLMGGELQGNTSHAIELNRCKQFNLLGTAIEGNGGMGIALGGNAAAVNIQAYFEGNLGGHIGPNAAAGVSAGTAQAVVIQAGSYLLRGTGGSTGPDLAIDIPRCRSFFLEDGVFIQGYASSVAPVIHVKDVGDSNRATGYIGNVTIDAPPALTLFNECQFFGREQRRVFHVNAVLPDDLVTTFKLPIWLGAATTAKRNPSSVMSVILHIEVTGAGNVVLSARGRDTAGVLVGTQVNSTAAVAVGYNRVSLTVGDSEPVAYVEALRTGSSGSDTATGVTLLSIEVITWENRVKSV